MDLSDVTGPFGIFQMKILFILLIRSICWSLLVVNYQFINQKPPFKCSDTVFINITNLSNNSDKFGNECKVATFKYSTDRTYSTITEEWDLVCSREWLTSLGYIVFFLGNFIAYIPAGQLADKIGRKPLILFGQGLMTIFALTLSFSTSMTMFLILRFFIGVGFGLVQTPLFAVYVESVGPKHRDYISYSFTVLWGLGIMTTSLLAWLIKDWRYILLVSSIPFQLPLLIGIYFLVPESTRWLLSTKRYDRAEQQLKMQAKSNGKKIDDYEPIMAKLKEKIDLDRKADHASFVDLWKNKQLLKVTVILYISFILTVFINHGFPITIALEGGSLYVNMALSGLMNSLVLFIYYPLVIYFNRRKSLLVSFTIVGILFLAVIAVSDDMLWLKLTLNLFGFLANSLSYTLLYVFANELFPTNLRAVGVSGAMACGRIGSILCPFADVLGRKYGKSMPLILYGVFSLVASVMFLLLPETKHKNLPDTVHDFDEMATERLTPGREVEMSEIKPTKEKLIKMESILINT